MHFLNSIFYVFPYNSPLLASSGPYRPLLARSGYPGQDASFYNNPIVMIKERVRFLLPSLVMICATVNVLMQLKTILCKFGRICATRNALMQLKTILCEFGQICVTGNALMQLKTILCEFGRICATRISLTQLKTILCEF